MLRVDVIDPSAYTPPYDHALCSALARAGVDVELVTSRFAYGSVPEPDGYRVRHAFYRAAVGSPGSRARRISKLAQHPVDMLAYRRAARAVDVVHFQWLTVEAVDATLLPRGRPLVLTAHDVLAREPRPGQLAGQRRLYRRADAVVVHSRAGRERLVDELSVAPEKVHVIPHGVFEHLPRANREGRLPPELASPETQVVLAFGTMRPYKGLDVLLEAWRGITGAELWIVGLPKMNIRPLQARAPEGVRWVPRFVGDEEIGPLFERADLVVLPYREIDQSGVLFTALAFERPLLLTAVGGFPEIAEDGAAALVPPGDSAALHEALHRLLSQPRERAALRARGQAIVGEKYGWDPIARRTVELYASLIDAKAAATPAPDALHSALRPIP